MDISAYYEQEGSGPPIVFIHGSFATHATWKKFVAALSADHLCISIKLPGHCGLPDPDDFDAPGFDTELQIVERVIHTLTDQPVHLVGHSFGGAVALALALKGTVVIRRLTMFEPVVTWVLLAADDNNADDQIQRFKRSYSAAYKKDGDQACQYVIDFWGGEGAFAAMPAAVQAAMAPLTRNNLRHWQICMEANYPLQALQQLSFPCTIIRGGESNPAAAAISNDLAANIPQCQQHVIAGASHFLVTTHADECIQVMMSDHSND